MLTLGLGLGLTAGSNVPGAPAPTPWPAAFYDDFGAPTGTLNGRTRPGGSWQTLALSGTNFDGLQVVTVGKLSGSIGTSPISTYGVYTPSETPTEQWVRRRTALAAFSSSVGADMLTVPNGGAVSKVALSWAASGNSGGLSITPTVNGVNGSGNTAVNVAVLAGDIIEERYFASGTDRMMDVYHNGMKIYADYNVTSKGVPLTFAHGFQGNIPAVSVEDFECGDAATMAMLRCESPARIRQRETNGDLSLILRGDYSGSAPSGLTYTLYNAATGAIVSGHDDQPLTSFSASSGTWLGKATIASASLPSSFYARVRRSGLAASASAYAFTPNMMAGEVIATYGQSLMQQMWSQTAGITLTRPANAWMVDGSTAAANSAVTSEILARVNTVPNNSPIALLAKTIMDGISSPPLSIIRGGVGGTFVRERIPGTATFTALELGIRRAGGNLSVLIDAGGHYDHSAAERANYAANMDLIVARIEEIVGHPIKVVLTPVGAIWNGNDADLEAMRRLQWQMTQDQPSRYYLGPYTMDLQHVDLYHLVITGDPSPYAEQARRMGKMVLAMKGVAGSDRNGPKLVSVVKNSSSQITVTFDLNGASGLELVNTAYASDFRGGLRFAAASSFASPLSPTGATINAVSGTTQSVTYTFSGTPFASSSAYVSGPYGSQPFNPTNDTTIRADVANKASMLRGQFSGEASIPVQPYYAAGGDYIVSP